jgi:hypothetical protein
MGEVERRILASALETDDSRRLRDLLRQYLAVRQVRTGALSEVQAVERSMERMEGTAHYVGCSAAALALGEPVSRVRECIRRELTRAVEEFPTWPEADAQLMRWRQYGTGAALGFLLDQLGAEWHAAVQRGAYLDVLLAEAVGFVPADAARLAEGALIRFGYEELLQHRRTGS